MLHPAEAPAENKPMRCIDVQKMQRPSTHHALWSRHASAQIKGKKLNACQPCNLEFFRVASLTHCLFPAPTLHSTQATTRESAPCVQRTALGLNDKSAESKTHSGRLARVRDKQKFTGSMTILYSLRSRIANTHQLIDMHTLQVAFPSKGQETVTSLEVLLQHGQPNQ